MIKNIIKYIYYFFYQFFFSNFLILDTIIFKKKIIFDKKNKFFFSQLVNNKNDLNTLRQIYIKEEYNIRNFSSFNTVQKFYDSIIDANKTPLIIDCGSNIGASLNYFYLMYKKSKLVGIEGDIDNYNISNKNIISKKIKIYNKVVSSDNCNYQIKDESIKDGRSKSFIKSDNGIMKSILLDDIIKEYPKENYIPFLIKIDLEGAEKELFNKNIEWFRLFPIIMIEIHDWLEPSKNVSSGFLKEINLLNNKDLLINNENLIVINYDALK